MHAIRGAWIIGGALVVLASCARRPEPRVGRAELTGTRMIMNDDAAMRLTNARCQRESACEDESGERRFADADACRRALFADTQAIVAPEACPAGVDEVKLALCASVLRGQDCGRPGLALEGETSCLPSELCEAP